WLFHSTITLPDGKSIKVDLNFACSETAGGRARVCSFGGEAPGMPPMDAGILIGADRLDGKVHFMAMKWTFPSSRSAPIRMPASMGGMPGASPPNEQTRARPPAVSLQAKFRSTLIDLPSGRVMVE